MHGIWGQKVLVRDKRLRVENSILSQDAEVTVLNQAYAFSKAQAVAALKLIEVAGFDPQEIRIATTFC